MKETHTVMGLDSIKFRQQIEIKLRKKNVQKGKGSEYYIAYMCQ